MSVKNGMSQEMSIDFLKDCNELIFKCFLSNQSFDRAFRDCISKYSQYPAALKVIERLERDADRVCATKTRLFFTAGHVASQRAESNNARVKQDPLMKER
jgi:hypothetical protein